ncbi:DUF1127 domain-containing protein [Kaustia mangrovi]|uniref:DUF1127 domain-containing protein n=1 Tax=Kaustia mangrovi TaxID=2593653 RepID=A0A7S8C5G8_9HYPH|nr:DUF1127 domain-containing protein [Kaustia mangrovi]QPC43717.1 DUF1127 domain-containing protein [Kaustia mangrovi]
MTVTATQTRKRHGRVAAWYGRLVAAIVGYRRRRRTLIMLEACDERVLRDIGIRLDWRRPGRRAAADENWLRHLDTMR